MNDYVTGEEFSDAEYINSCETRSIPTNYIEAINSPDAGKWKAAVEKEMRPLEENNTFTIRSLPENKNVVGGKWVYSIKEGDEVVFKARYVAKGYSQIKDIDYHETYALTTKMSRVRTLMQLCAQYDLIVCTEWT